jgi:hypothetical protein
VSDEADPGWGPALRTLPVMIVPFVGMSRAVKSANSLIVVRSLWMLFAGAIIMMGVMAALISTGEGLDGVMSQGTALAAAAGVGVVAQLLAARFVHDPDLSGETTFVPSFQRWFFVRVGAAEVAALGSFTLFVLSGAPLVYYVGAAIALAALWDVRPGRTRLRQLQAAADEEETGLQVVQALECWGLTR